MLLARYNMAAETTMSISELEFPAIPRAVNVDLPDITEYCFSKDGSQRKLGYLLVLCSGLASLSLFGAACSWLLG